jgi:hypothetical protein
MSFDVFLIDQMDSSKYAIFRSILIIRGLFILTCHMAITNADASR